MCPDAAHRLTMPRGIVALRAVAGDAARAAAPPDRCVPVPPFELKEIQRRAFERGQACEREAQEKRLAGILERMAEAAAALDAARAEDREQLARFGVDVAIAVAGHLTGAAIGRREHDIRALVEGLLEEALPGLGGGALQIAVHPDDLEPLAELLGPGAPPAVAGRVHPVADPGLPRASCRIRANGAEILADPKVRLAAIAERLRALAAAEQTDA